MIGSMEVASAKSGSGTIAAGLLLHKITLYPSSRSARTACVPLSSNSAACR